MRLNAIMALATVASVVGVMGSATVGSMSARHHYFQGAGQGGPGQHSIPVELTSQLTGSEEPAPLAFMLLSDLVPLPAGGFQGPLGPSDGAPGFGADGTTSQFLDSAFGGGGGGGGGGGALGNLADGQGAASAENLAQDGPPDTSQFPQAPPQLPQGPPGAPSFSGDNGVIFAGSPPGPGTPPTGGPPILPPILPSVPPPSPPPVPDLAPPPLPPPAGLVAPPSQNGASSGPPAIVSSAIPEPGTWLLLVLGLGLTGAMLPGRRRGAWRRPPPSAA